MTNLKKYLDNIKISSNDKNIIIKEVFEQDVYKLKQQIDKNIDFIIDIGANVGVFSICCRYYFPKCRIISIEPFPETYSMLENNVKRLKIETINVPFGDGSKLLLINPHKGNGGAQCFPNGDTKSWTLKEIFNYFKLDKNKNFILKSDCEGGEKYFLHEDNIKFLSLCKFFTSEFHKRHKNSDISLCTDGEIEEIINIIKKTHNYKIEQCAYDEYMFNLFAERKN